MPYSRMDRIQEKGTAFSLKILTELIKNNLKALNLLFILDPHSKETLAQLNSIARTYSRELREFVFNHTHKYIATMITGGIEDVAIVIAPERKINNQKGE